ncbi:MAG: hypothetical protein JNM25_05250 [Planctomycetes bacterium]|nr:hypothetical protein [Planctomycetota bacterium]
MTALMHEPPPLPESRAPLPWWAAAAGMLALALVAYLAAALRAEFVNFDDNLYFGPDNPEFRAGLGAVLDPHRPIANVWLPVAHASLWFDFWLANGKPLWPHAVALLLHAAAATVLVRLLGALGARRWLAFAGGALFVAHPALAESVAWVSGRKDVLSGLFVFAALLQTVRCGERASVLRLILLALLGALAMYSKATAVVLPLLSLLVCCYVRGSPRRLLAPLVLLLVTLPIAWHHQHIATVEGTLAGGGIGERLGQVPGAFWHYVATTLWPLRLNVLYPEVDTLAQFRAQVGLGSAVLAALLLAAVVAWRRPAWRLLAFGVLLFTIALLPFNTAFPGSSIAAADRYLYLALPGAALALLVAADRLLPRAAPWLAGALLLPLLWLCGGRAHDFGDSETLWRQSLAVQPANAVARLNLCKELLRRGPASVDELRTHLEAAVAAARYPNHELQAHQLLVQVAMRIADYPEAARHARAAIRAAEALVALETAPRRRAAAGALLLQACLQSFEPLRLAGDLAEAEANCDRARALQPQHPDVIAFDQLRALQAAVAERPAAAAATALLADDDARGSVADRVLGPALERFPAHAGLWCTQAAWDSARGRLLPALRDYRRALDADPQCIDAWLGAARLLRGRDNFPDAERYARLGLAQRPDPALRQELALALVGQGRLDDAILQLEACLRVRPDDADTAKVLANVLIGRAYARLSEPDADAAEVLRIVQRALALNPNEGKAHLVLGRLAREQRRFAAAVEHFEAAFRLLPEFEDARQFLAESLADLGYERILQRDDEAAGAAFRRCLDVAPAGFGVEGVQLQLQAIWRRSEQRGVDRLQVGDRAGAVAAFRRCLQLDPTQHWAAWLLASALHDDPAADLGELETLCRQAVAWQQRHGLDRSQQVYLLAATLAKAGKVGESQQFAREFLHEPQTGTRPAVLAALRRLAGE